MASAQKAFGRFSTSALYTKGQLDKACQILEGWGFEHDETVVIHPAFMSLKIYKKPVTGDTVQINLAANAADSGVMTFCSDGQPGRIVTLWDFVRQEAPEPGVLKKIKFAIAGLTR